VTVQLQEAYLTKKKAIGRKPKIYPDLDACVKKLMANNQTLAEHSAKAIVKRSTEQVEGRVHIRMLQIQKPLEPEIYLILDV
jgi:alpha-galactosidase/6-phospho-beta-glucosidase family protein